MQDKDFSGQDLRGRSFKNQDLTGANFSGCDVRGVDFSGATLTKVKFCQARMGRTLTASFGVLILQLLIAGLCGIIAAIGNIFILLFAEDVLKVFGLSFGINQIIFIVIYSLLFTMVIFLAVHRNYLNYLLWFLILMIAIGGLIVSIGVEADIGKIIVAVAGVMVGVIAGFVAVAAIAFGMAAVIGSTTINEYLALIIMTTCVMAVAIADGGGMAIKVIEAVVLKDKANLMQAQEAIAGALSCILYIGLNFYLGKRSINQEEKQLSLFRYLSLKFNCFWGTEFSFTILQAIDFASVDFKDVSFQDANISRCYFQNVKNHHLAITQKTRLESNKIRKLVIDKDVDDKNFESFDLRNLVFSGLNLEGLNLSYANLCGANLSHTKMTGAMIENWNIDIDTDLNNIDCKYYYYLENGKKKRMPPEGEDYEENEFSHIFQKIANTIDFIAHNETELAAIKLSIEQVKVESGNNEIRIQAIEEKDGKVIVKINVPKAEDRGVVYHEINSLKQGYETKIQIMMDEQQAQIGNYELQIKKLHAELNKQRNDFLVAIKKPINSINVFVEPQNNKPYIHQNIAKPDDVIEKKREAYKQDVKLQKVISVLELNTQTTSKNLTQIMTKFNRFEHLFNKFTDVTGSETELMLLKNDIRHLTEEQEYLRRVNASKAPIILNNQLANKSMNGDNRNQSFSGNNNNNINLGDNSTLTNSIQQLPESNHDLKELLTQLSALIEKTTLPNEEKKDVAEDIEAIIQARKKPDAEQQSIIAKALRSLKRFETDLSDAPKALAKYSQLIKQIGNLF